MLMKAVYSKHYGVNIGEHPWHASNYALVLDRLFAEWVIADADVVKFHFNTVVAVAEEARRWKARRVMPSHSIVPVVTLVGVAVLCIYGLWFQHMLREEAHLTREIRALKEEQEWLKTRLRIAVMKSMRWPSTADVVRLRGADILGTTNSNGGRLVIRTATGDRPVNGMGCSTRANGRR